MTSAALTAGNTFPIDSPPSDRDAADAYRIKLYKVAIGERREERERLRQEWDARNRARS